MKTWLYAGNTAYPKVTKEKVMTLSSVVQCIHCKWYGAISQCTKIDDDKVVGGRYIAYRCPTSNHDLVIEPKTKTWFDFDIAQANAILVSE